MAKVRDNLVTEGLSGKLGKRLVFRKGRKGKTILATLPVENEKRQFNDAQKAHQGAFKKAIAYAKVAKTQPLYVALGKQVDEAAYNLAVADWFGQPEVLELDSAGWRGQAGQTIRIRAEDDTQVESVEVIIQTPDGRTKFEQGQAELLETDGSWWVYTSTSIVSLASPLHIVAIARDLPGNSNSMVVRTT
jgi:hypothetical protein